MNRTETSCSEEKYIRIRVPACALHIVQDKECTLSLHCTGSAFGQNSIFPVSIITVSYNSYCALCSVDHLSHTVNKV